MQRRLVGYRWEPSTAKTAKADTLSEIDPPVVARIVAQEGEPDLPWELAAETLAAATSPSRAFCLDHHAYALVGSPAAETLRLTALVVPRIHRRQGWGSRLLHALSATFPGRAWSISYVVPEDLAPGFFAKLGWDKRPLILFEMRLGLASE